MTRSVVDVYIGNYRLPSDLRKVVKVRKDLTPALNRASITIFNCSPDTQKLAKRAAISKIPIEVHAGNGTFQNRVVRTTINYVTVENNSDGNSLTLLETRDGEDAKEIFPNQNFPKGVTVVDVLQALLALIPDIDSTQVQAEIAKGTFENTSLYTFKNGYATQGNVIEALNTLLVGAGGLRWTLQDDKIIILPANGLLPNPPLLISKDTNMIGSPITTERGLEAVTTFTHLVTPGAAVVIESVHLPARFEGRVEQVIYDLDSYGKAWYSKFEAINVNDPTFADIDYLLVSDV